MIQGGGAVKEEVAKENRRKIHQLRSQITSIMIHVSMTEEKTDIRELEARWTCRMRALNEINNNSNKTKMKNE